MDTMKLYEIGIVHIITKALKMHINNRYNTWEARQLFFLTSTLEKKNEVTCKILPRTCLHSTGQVVSDITRNSPRSSVALGREGSQHPKTSTAWSSRCSPRL